MARDDDDPEDESIESEDEQDEPVDESKGSDAAFEKYLRYWFIDRARVLADRIVADVKGDDPCAPAKLAIGDKLFFLTEVAETKSDANKAVRFNKSNWDDEENRRRPREVRRVDFEKPMSACEEYTHKPGGRADYKRYSFGIYLEMTKRGGKWSIPRDAL